MDYTLIKKQDVYSLTNNEVQGLTCVVVLVNECTTMEETISTMVIPPAGVYEIPLVKDGKYRLDLSTETPEQATENINYFLTLQKSIIMDAQDSVCDCNCGCGDCADTPGSSEALLTTRSKLDIFKLLTNPDYDECFKAAAEASKCDLASIVYCNILQESVNGINVYNETLAMKMIAIDYLAMYFCELKGLTDQEDIDYVNDKFNAETMLCCISKLGIDIQAIKDAINAL
jgi:hypothetical protein